MKFIKEQPAGDGHVRYLFALGKTEAQILYGLLDKAIVYSPRLFETSPIDHRMTDMIRAIRSAIPEMDNGGRDGGKLL